MSCQAMDGAKAIGSSGLERYRNRSPSDKTSRAPTRTLGSPLCRLRGLPRCRLRHAERRRAEAVPDTGRLHPPRRRPIPGPSLRQGPPRWLLRVRHGARLPGRPYRNGGSDPSGFDCSGFVQYVFARHGKSLPREVSEHSASEFASKTPRSRPAISFLLDGHSGPSHVAVAMRGDETRPRTQLAGCGWGLGGATFELVVLGTTILGTHRLEP